MFVYSDYIENLYLEKKAFICSKRGKNLRTQKLKKVSEKNCSIIFLFLLLFIFFFFFFLVVIGSWNPIQRLIDDINPLTIQLPAFVMNDVVLSIPKEKKNWWNQNPISNPIHKRWRLSPLSLFDSLICSVA